MKKKIKIIGLLGGIGPEATGEFYLFLIKKFQEKNLIRSNKDYPRIIINSIPAPELIYENISEKSLGPYIKGLKDLEKIGADFIVMICNTIYLFYEKLQKEIKIPIIDLRREVENYLLRNKIKSIVVLGSPNVIKGRLYNFERINCISLKDKEIDLLSNAVFNFNKGFDKIKQKVVVKRIAKKYLNRGIELIILGCTEVALMLKDEDMPKINPMDILAEAIIKESIK